MAGAQPRCWAGSGVYFVINAWAGTRREPPSACHAPPPKGNAIASDGFCDLRSGRCVSNAFACEPLAQITEGRFTCAASGDFLSTCSGGQPHGVHCEGSTSCSSDGTFNCYTAPKAGESCGGPSVCYPGLHCHQTSAGASRCVQPAGNIACSADDRLAVCTDADTAGACYDGTVWWWKNLTSWGGSCRDSRPVIPAGATCIPGVADCAPGLACHKSDFDIAGTCRPRSADAEAACALTQQVAVGKSCSYGWNACQNGKQYGIVCQSRRIGAHVITLCNCEVNGTKVEEFTGSEVCQVKSVEALDTLANEKCGWDVRTTSIGP